ncbi:MAG: hypothetical protein PWP22_1247 [Thermoanaerobacter sp.]|nr:hypothetical protein [Thermoanaerobacter sp.]
MNPRVSIVILNWNGWKDTLECLESLYRVSYPNYDIIVVDNNSTDDSVQKIKEYAEGKIHVSSKFFIYNSKNKPIKVFEITEDEAKQGKFNRPLYEKIDPDRRIILIKNKDNYGFTKGNNIGAKFALNILNPNYILFLNNDTVVDSTFLDELIKISESQFHAGILGPAVYWYESNIIQFAGGSQKLTFFIPKHNTEYLSDASREVDYIYGACMLLNTKMIKEIKLLDEALWSFREENEYALRAKQKGWKCIYVPYSRIWHKGGSSFGRMNRKIAYLLGKNDMYILVKYGHIYEVAIFILFVVPINMTTYLRIYCKDEDCYHLKEIFNEVILPYLNGILKITDNKGVRK